MTDPTNLLKRLGVWSGVWIYVRCSLTLGSSTMSHYEKRSLKLYMYIYTQEIVRVMGDLDKLLTVKFFVAFSDILIGTLLFSVLLY